MLNGVILSLFAALVPVSLGDQNRSASGQRPPVCVSSQNLSPSPSVDLPAAPKDLDEKHVVWIRLRAGTGARRPNPDALVTVAYTVWNAAGEMLGRCPPRTPATWALDQIFLRGVRQALADMVVGERRRVWMAQDYAYRHFPGLPEGALVFDLELLSIAAPLVTVPRDVERPPAGASHTASGIAYRVLRSGRGARQPTTADAVTVHYSAWKTDGTLFDSSVARGQPVSFRLDTALPGWKEGLQLMHEGEQTRFWIPEKLALAGVPPLGPIVVFDIELIAIR